MAENTHMVLGEYTYIKLGIFLLILRVYRIVA